jgi:hypothetical protein
VVVADDRADAEPRGHVELVADADVEPWANEASGERHGARRAHPEIADAEPRERVEAKA